MKAKSVRIISLLLAVVFTVSLFGFLNLNNLNAVAQCTPFVRIKPIDNATLTAVEAKSTLSGEAAAENSLNYLPPVKSSAEGTDAKNANLINGGDRLTGLAQVLYQSIRPQAEAVSAGTRDCINTGLIDISGFFPSTVMESPVSGEAPYTLINSLKWSGNDYDGDTIWDAADAAVEELLQSITPSAADSKQHVMHSLLCDIPNEIVWFDKTRGMESGYTYGLAYEPNYNFYFIPSVYYAATLHVTRDYITYTETDWNEETQEGTGLIVDHIDSEKLTADLSGAHTAAQAILDAAKGKSDEEKLKFYHDEICRITGYDNTAANNGMVYGNSWQMINVFDNDPATRAVCEGYSKAFKYLCDNTDFENDTISCLITTGNLYQNSTLIGGHMWNTLVVNNQSYIVDITNDDTDDQENLYYDMFLNCPKQGDLHSVYVFSRQRGGTIGYYYDPEMFYVFDESVLDLSYTEFFTPVTNPDPSDFGTCSDSGSISWAIITSENAGDGTQTALRIYPSSGYELPDLSNPANNYMTDYVYDGTYSTAPWHFTDDTAPTAREINTVSVENGITAIGAYAFAGQSSLESAELSPDLTEIREGAFAGCDGLKKILFHGTREQWGAITIATGNEVLSGVYVECDGDEPSGPDSGVCNGSGAISWEISADAADQTGTRNILKIYPTDGYTLPDSDNPDYSVINDYSYNDVFSTAPWAKPTATVYTPYKIHTAIIENGITQIGSYAFADQKYLDTVHIYPSVKTIKEGAFENCRSLNEVYFHGTTGQWENVVMESGNDVLNTAIVYCIVEHDHEWGEWTVTRAATCTENGQRVRICTICSLNEAEAIASLGHKFIKKAETKFMKSKADCTHKAVYYESCERCGIMNANTFEYGKALGHLWNIAWVRDGEYHWHACNDCGEKKDLAPHVYDNKRDATCNECGYTRVLPPLPIDFSEAVAVVESKSVKSGDTVTLNVELDKFPLTQSLSISNLVYNTDIFTLTGVQWQVNGATVASWDDAKGEGLLTVAEAADLNYTVLTLTFKVSKNAQGADYSIGFSLNADDGGTSAGFVPVTVVPGVVTVKTYTAGDVNEDGNVTDADAVYLLFYTFFPEDYPVNQPADFNGDGNVTDADAVYLLFYTFFPDDYPLNAG